MPTARTLRRRQQKTHADILKQARARYDQAETAEHDQIQRELDDLGFYAGEHWPTELKNSRKGFAGGDGRPAIPERPCLVINELRDPVRHVAAEAQQTDLAPEIVPADDFAGLIGPIDPKEIELREGLVRRIQRDSSARDARNWGADRARIAGRGYYVVMVRYCSARSMDQEVFVDLLYNQSTVRLDPRHEKDDGSDAEWGFYGTTMSWDSYKALHPNRASKPKGAESKEADDEEWRGLGDEAPGWFEQDGDERSVRVMNYFYTVHDSITLVELADGRCVEDGDLQETDVPVLDADGKRVDRIADDTSVRFAKIDGAQILDATDWESPYIPIVKVVGEKLQPYDNEVRYQGMVRPARDPQFGADVMATTEVEVAMLAPKTPVVGVAGQFEGYEAAWDTLNVRNAGRVEYNARTDATGDHILPPPGPLIRNSDISTWDGLRQMFRQAIKTTTGVPDATLGNVDPSIRSGRGIKALQDAASQGTSGYLANLVKSVTYEVKIINSLLYPIYGRRPGRLLQMMTGKHESQAVLVGQPFVRDAKQRPQPFDPQQHQGQEPSQYQLTEDADFNVAIRVSKNYDTQRQEEQSLMGELIGQNPVLITWFGDLFFENQDGPGHKDMAERAKVMLDPRILATLNKDKNSQVPPEVQAQLQQLQQQLQQAQQALQTDQAKQQATIQTAQIKAQADAQGAQLKVQSDAQQAQMEAQQALQLQQMKDAAELQMAETKARIDAESTMAIEQMKAQLAIQLEEMKEASAFRIAEMQAKSKERQTKRIALTKDDNGQTTGLEMSGGMD